MNKLFKDDNGLNNNIDNSIFKRIITVEKDLPIYLNPR